MAWSSLTKLRLVCDRLFGCGMLLMQLNTWRVHQHPRWLYKESWEVHSHLARQSTGVHPCRSQGHRGMVENALDYHDGSLNINRLWWRAWSWSQSPTSTTSWYPGSTPDCSHQPARSGSADEKCSRPRFTSASSTISSKSSTGRARFSPRSCESSKVAKRSTSFRWRHFAHSISFAVINASLLLLFNEIPFVS